VARTKTSNPHELQAKWSLLLAIIGGLCALLLIASVLRHFDLAEFAAYYKKGSPRLYVILASTALGLAASGIGFFVALNSAGQKRNPLSGLAWKAFFMNALIFAVTLCMFLVFFFAKEEVA
jgi:uncharacterized membrane protein